MKTKSLSIFLVALFVGEMNLGTEMDNNENKEVENLKYKILEEVDDSLLYFSLKTVLIGNCKVGKTALATKICKNIFEEIYTETIGFEFYALCFKILNGENNPLLKYQIWDCCGAEIYRNLITSFFSNSSVFLFVYDVTNKDSYCNIEKWVEEVKDKNSSAKNRDNHIHFVLIGTKIDLEGERVVSKEEGKNFAEKNGMKFVEVSAKTGVGIKELEYILAKIIYEDFKKHKEKEIVEEDSDEKIVEDDIKVDFIGDGKHTHSSSLCYCCKEICDNC